MDTQQQLKDHDTVTEMKGMLKQILEQTTRTNGRVTKCEDNINNLMYWKNYIAGGLSLICIVGLPLLFILVNDVKKDGDLIKTHVAKDVGK